MCKAWANMQCRIPLLMLLSTTLAVAQVPAPLSASQIRMAAGDRKEDPGPLATDLSHRMTKRDIRRAMRRVADWQMKESATRFNADWTYAPLYLGLLATAETLQDRKYHDAVLAASTRFEWKLWAERDLFADDEAIAQTYEWLYQENRDPIRLADTKSTFDRLVARPDDAKKDLWWWCDALFMAPAGLARLSTITGDHAYIDKMDQEWALTANHLYNQREHLFARDKNYLNKVEANGKPVFWARGNGWVMAGAVNVLKALPEDDPSRARYIQLLREMSERVAALQQRDGLWHSGLLQQDAYELPEVSGSAFFIYAMAWGIRENILDRELYMPVVRRGWAGLIRHVYLDGRLGCVQPIGGAPGVFKPGSSYVYGVGAFLLAGAELERLARP